MQDKNVLYEMILIKVQQRGFKITLDYRNYLYELFNERPLTLELMTKFYKV